MDMLEYKLGDIIPVRHPKSFKPYRGISFLEAWIHSRRSLVDDIEYVILDTPEKVIEYNASRKNQVKNADAP